MKRIKIYFFSIAFLAMVLGGSICLYAAEETSSMMCDGGMVNIGDSDVDVRDNCGDPDTQGSNQWVYDFGPGQSYTVIFEDGKIVRILESH
jgi:hypothetical protein